MGVIIKKYGLQVEREGQDPIKITGNRASRTQQLSDLTKLATPELRKMIEDLRNYFSDYKKGLLYGMSGVAAARFLDDFNQKVADILSGKIKDPSLLYSSTNLDQVTENRYGHYSKASIDAMGDTAARNYANSSKLPATTTPASTTGAVTTGTTTGNTTTALPATTTGKRNYNFKALEGLSSFSKDLYNDDDWRNKILETISGNLTKAGQALDRGDNVWWGTDSNLSKEDIALMQGILDRQTNWTDLTAARLLAKALDSVFSRLGVNSPELLSYFRFGETDEEKRLKALADKGYTPSNMTFDTPAADYLSQQGWTPWKYGNQTVLLDRDDNPVTTSSIKFWQDPTKAGYGNVFTVGPNGSFYYGTINVADDNPFRDQIALGLKSQKEQNDKTFSQYNYGGNYLYPDLVLQVAGIEGMSPTMSYVDVSNRFSGNNPVIAVSGNGSADVPTDQFGNLNLSDPNVRLFTIGQDGKYVERPYNEMIAGGYRVGGYPEEVQELLKPTDLYQFVKQILLKDVLPFQPSLNIYGRSGWIHPANKYWNKNILDDPNGFVKMMVLALADPNKIFTVGPGDTINSANLLNNHKASTPEGRALLIANLYQYMQAHPDILMDPETLLLWINIIKLYNATRTAQSLKEGSVVTAKLGTILGADGKEYTPDQLKTPKPTPVPSIYTTGKQEAVGNREPSQDRKGIDIVRFAGLLADGVSLISSFVPGVGTGISAVSGVAGSVADFAADMEDGFLWKDLKNLGINIGLDVAGLFGGAGKVAKFVKKLKPYMPYIEAGFVAAGAANAISNADLYINVFKKLDVGQKMSIEDWRTVALGLTLLAGSTRLGSSVFKQKYIKNLNSKLDVQEAAYKVNTTKKDTKLTKAQIDEINSVKPAEGQTPLQAKNKKLQEITKDPTIEFVPDKADFSWKHPFRRGNTGDWSGVEVDLANPDFKAVSSEDAAAAAETLKKYKRQAFGISDYDIYTSRHGNPSVTAPTTRQAAPEATTPPPAKPTTADFTDLLTEEYYKNGGKFERLQAYINSK